jgi:hypothetical protein
MGAMAADPVNALEQTERANSSPRKAVQRS